MDYIIFDLEWNQPVNSAKSPEMPHGEIIQIGFIAVSGSFDITHREELMIKPVIYRKMNPYVSTLTGIKQSDIDGGLTFADAFGRFAEHFGGDTVLITWGDDDMPILRENLAYHGIDISVLPKHYNLQRIFAAQTDSHARQTGLRTAAGALGITEEMKAHDALNDAYLTYLIAAKLDIPRGIETYTEPAPEPSHKEQPPWETEKPAFTVKSAFPGNPSGMANECRRLHYCCPKCGKDFLGTEPVRHGKNSFVGIGECRCAGALFFRYSLKDGFIRISAFRMTDELDMIYKARLSSREKREKRRELFRKTAAKTKREKND